MILLFFPISLRFLYNFQLDRFLYMWEILKSVNNNKTIDENLWNNIRRNFEHLANV